MKASEFIGKTVKNISIEEKFAGRRSFLFTFDDGSMALFHDESRDVFFTADGDSVEDDIPELTSREFWSKLP